MSVYEFVHLFTGSTSGGLFIIVLGSRGCVLWLTIYIEIFYIKEITSFLTSPLPHQTFEAACWWCLLNRQTLSLSLPFQHNTPCHSEMRINSNAVLKSHESLQFRSNCNAFHFGCLTGLIIMISMWLSVIVMLVAFVNGARNGECCSQNEKANLNGNSEPAFTEWIVITHFLPFASGRSVQTKYKTCHLQLRFLSTCHSLINFLIVRGWRRAVCKGPDGQLRGAFGVARQSHLCHQKDLPSRRWTDFSHRVATRRTLIPRQPLSQWEQHRVGGFYTELQSHQEFPRLLGTGLDCSSGRRSGDQSWMWERFQLLVHVFCYLHVYTKLETTWECLILT